jgi:uncharacterized protein YfdQ (DUF2303 family)
MFPFYGGKFLSRKAVHNWVEKFSQGYSKVADNARSSRPVETATEATVQRVEELIRANGKITMFTSNKLSLNFNKRDCIQFKTKTIMSDTFSIPLNL